MQPAELPISSGEWRWSDRSSNGFSIALMSGWLPQLHGEAAVSRGGHLQLPMCPQLPALLCETSPPQRRLSVCLPLGAG